MKQEFPSFYTGTYPTAKLAGNFFYPKIKFLKSFQPAQKVRYGTNGPTKRRYQNEICLTLTLIFSNKNTNLIYIEVH